MRHATATNSARSARRGFTLIEVLIVVSTAAALLGVCAVSIQLLMRLSADVQARYSAAVAVERLGRQLRDDAHVSQTAEIVDIDQKSGKPAGLRLVLEPDRTVRYDFGNGGVIRTESRTNSVVRHETFTLPRGTAARFELRDQGSRRLVVLVMTRSPGRSQTDPPRPLEVVAIQGKDKFGPLEKQGAKPR